MHIARGEMICNHTTISAWDLLASEDSNTAILFHDGRCIYIEKKVQYTFQRKYYSVYGGRPLVKPMIVVASDGYIIDIIGPYLVDGKNNDAAILNKHLSKKKNCISKWSDKNLHSSVRKWFQGFS